MHTVGILSSACQETQNPCFVHCVAAVRRVINTRGDQEKGTRAGDVTLYAETFTVPGDGDPRTKFDLEYRFPSKVAFPVSKKSDTAEGFALDERGSRSNLCRLVSLGNES